MSGELDFLLDSSTLPQPRTMRWATVTALGPARIRYDGETSPLNAEVSVLVAGLALGDRVLVAVVDGVRPAIISTPDVDWTASGFTWTASGFAPYVGDGWDGVKVCLRGGTVCLSGAIYRDGGWSAGWNVLILPSRFWPDRNATITMRQGDATGSLKVLPTGAVTCQTSSTSTAANFTGSWPARRTT